MINIFPFILSFFITMIPSHDFRCDNDLLNATIRNNLNGDFALVNDLEKIDQGAFIVLEWRDVSLMLPISFQAGEISFTDKKWLWSYQDNENGLRMDNPRFAQRIPSGEIVEHECKAIYKKASEKSGLSKSKQIS